jgi:hypothetical protein
VKITLEQQIWFSRKASTQLKSLKPVFKELLRVHQDYVNGERGDCPYWYKERSHISLLAAATWRCPGGIALEEYGAEKYGKGKHGRCDLGIRVSLKIGFECEAKQFSPNIGAESAARLCRAVDAWLNRAVNAVKQLKSREGLALCFVRPAIRKSKVHALDARLREWFNLLRKEPNHDVLVWIGIGKGQEPFGDEWKFPGLLLAIKEVR